MRQRRTPVVTRLARQVEAERRAGLEVDMALGEPADAELGALEVDQDADRPVIFLLQPADDVEALAMIGVAAMAEIEPEDVGAGLEQAADHLRRRARRPERGEDLDVALASHAAGASSSGRVTQSFITTILFHPPCAVRRASQSSRRRADSGASLTRRPVVPQEDDRRGRRAGSGRGGPG